VASRSLNVQITGDAKGARCRDPPGRRAPRRARQEDRDGHEGHGARVRRRRRGRRGVARRRPQEERRRGDGRAEVAGEARGAVEGVRDLVPGARERDRRGNPEALAARGPRRRGLCRTRSRTSSGRPARERRDEADGLVSDIARAKHIDVAKAGQLVAQGRGRAGHGAEPVRDRDRQERDEAGGARAASAEVRGAGRRVRQDRGGRAGTVRRRGREP
jgi:hypothetical protein